MLAETILGKEGGGREREVVLVVQASAADKSLRPFSLEEMFSL